jgi:hypothetical protein
MIFKVNLLKKAAATLFDKRADLDYSVAFTTKEHGGVEEHYHGEGNKIVQVTVKEETLTYDQIHQHAQSFLASFLDPHGQSFGANPAGSASTTDKIKKSGNANDTPTDGNANDTLTDGNAIDTPTDRPRSVTIFLKSDKFLYKMVRRIVGCLVEIAKGRLRFPSAGDGGARSFRTKEIKAAPAEGLRLEHVEYEDP